MYYIIYSYLAVLEARISRAIINNIKLCLDICTAIRMTVTSSHNFFY